MEFINELEQLTNEQKIYLLKVIEQNELQIDKKFIAIIKENKFNFKVLSLLLYSFLLPDAIQKLNLSEIDIKLVKNIKKINDLEIKIDKENQYEDYRNLIVLLAEDYLVLICILIIRLKDMKQKKKEEFANKEIFGQISLNIYAPIAHRLGLGNIKSELEELSLYYMDYDNYKKVASLLEVKKAEREKNLNNIIKEINNHLQKKLKLTNYQIKGRNKSIYSIYKKTLKINKNFSEIYDFQGIRIICQTKEECYSVLGIIHEHYIPISGRFKDYIALKKPNLYQSLHTSVYNKKDEIFEVQIRTYEMDEIAERGVAAHWIYKSENNESLKDIEEQLHLFRDLIDTNEQQIIENLNKEVFASTIYVYTPTNKIIMLPVAATVIDFAYKIHTKVGNSIQMAIVNDKIETFDTKLKNGDVVKIITKEEENSPKKEWLDFVQTNHAKKKIKTYINQQNKKLNLNLIEKGYQKLDKLIKDKMIKYDLINDTKLQGEILNKLNIKSLDYFCKELLEDNTLIAKVNRVNLIETANLKVKKIKNKNKDIIIPGIDNLQMQFAKCCMPIYGDEIIGNIRTGQYISIHKKDCKACQKEQFIDVTWTPDNQERYLTALIIIAEDRNSLLSDITTVLSKFKVSLGNAKSIVKEEIVKTEIELYIKNIEELNIIINSLKNLATIQTVQRK
ncbi:MAG: RelA/SpoT family protein [Mycoplasmatales bacterium]